MEASRGRGSDQEPAAIEASLVILLERAARSGSRVLNGATDGMEIRRGELCVLLELRVAKELAQRELVALTGLDPGDLARAVTSLEDRDLVVRRPDETDGRKRSVRLTRRGRAMAEKLHGAAASADEALLSGLSERQQVELRRLLRRMVTLDVLSDGH
jgi:DNA-binding MarR family transcriptional regulator